MTEFKSSHHAFGKFVDDATKLVNREQTLSAPAQHANVRPDVLNEELVATAKRRARLVLRQRDPWHWRHESKLQMLAAIPHRADLVLIAPQRRHLTRASSTGIQIIERAEPTGSLALM